MNKKSIASTSARRRLTPGRPTAYQFQGLFLPSIEWEMKSEGFPWHELENEPNELGTLIRNLRRQDVDPTGSLLKVLPIIQKMMPPSTAVQFEALARAVEEGSVTDEMLAKMPGKWASFRMGAAKDKSPYLDEYVQIEDQCQGADTALHEGNYRRASELVRSIPSLRQYWSEEALQDLASATTINEALRPRLQAWLQLQVDVLAKWSMREPRALQTQHHCGNFAYLLTDLRDDDSAAPGALWLRAMIRLTKAKSLAEMIEQVRNETLHSDLPSEATIKRWSRASMFPVQSPKLENFVERVSRRAVIADSNLNHSEVFESAMWYHWAARRFDSMLWFATLSHVGSLLPTPDIGKHTHAPSAWLRAEFKRLQSHHAPEP